jgi:hypothetical protein
MIKYENSTYKVHFHNVTINKLFCPTVFAIYFVDRKYEVNSWIDIGIMFDSSDILLNNFTGRRQFTNAKVY